MQPSQSPSACAEDALNPKGFTPPPPFALFPGRQPRHKPSRTRIPLRPVLLVEKSLPGGGTGMGQLLAHSIELSFHHLESREETTKAPLLGCTRSAPLGNAWHWMPAAPLLPGATLLFPEDLCLLTPLLPSLVPSFSVSPAGPLPSPSLGMPCLLSFPLP